MSINWWTNLTFHIKHNSKPLKYVLYWQQASPFQDLAGTGSVGGTPPKKR